VKRNDALPDDILVEIFDFNGMLYATSWPPADEGKSNVEAWQLLAHVCRRWRNVVFRSPRRLKLRLYCTPRTPARDTLDVWPALPLVFVGNVALPPGADNVVAALGQSNHVFHVRLRGLATRQLEEILTMMHVSFPKLTDLRLVANDETLSIIPDSFLGGSAPRLRYFRLSGIPFPGLPKMVLSATRLGGLELTEIPHSGYVSPEAMAALLSALPELKTLILEFRSPQSCPDRESQSLLPSKRFTLPFLHYFRFKGVTEYLEVLVNFIDTRRLCYMKITFFNQIDFDLPRLAQFTNRTSSLETFEAHVRFDDSSVILQYGSTEILLNNPHLRITVSCREPDWQLSSIEQICNSSLLRHPLSTTNLHIEHEYSQVVWNDEAIEDTLWLQLLLSFTGVVNLFLSKGFAPRIAAALKESVEGNITEVLPSLQNILVEGLEEASGPFRENIGQFVAARQLSDHPIVVSYQGENSDMGWMTM
jgi:hypothetical protein